MNKIITTGLLQSVVEKKDYIWYENKPNLIGIRTTLQVPNIFNDIFCLVWKQPNMHLETTDIHEEKSVLGTQLRLNEWNYIGKNGLKLKEDGKWGTNTAFAFQNYLDDVTKSNWRLKFFTCTTIPGVYYLNHPLNNLGTAVVVPGQYKDVWQVGYHKNNKSHPALVQTGAKIKVWRDNDKDKLAEPGIIDEGYFGINFHGMINPIDITKIDKWSAGCQVAPIWADKEMVVNICKRFKQYVPNNEKFTYTLLEETDL